jgi:lysophospholipase L1-like esterase
LRAVTNYIITKIKSELAGKEIIFVMDAPRSNIYSNDLANARVAWLNTMVGEICTQQNLPFIDLTPYMLKDFQKNGKRFESEYDNHWSGYGHQLVANTVNEYFKNAKH